MDALDRSAATLIISQIVKIALSGDLKFQLMRRFYFSLYICRAYAIGTRNEAFVIWTDKTSINSPDRLNQERDGLGYFLCPSLGSLELWIYL